MYGLTNAEIVDALLAAKRRGVDVALKLDKLESAGKTQAVMITKLQAAGVPVEVPTQVRHLHHRFAVIDGRYVITGSFNWTENAERRNRENLVILKAVQSAQDNYVMGVVRARGLCAEQAPRPQRLALEARNDYRPPRPRAIDWRLRYHLP